MMAANQNNKDEVIALLKGGADHTKVNYANRTALQIISGKNFSNRYDEIVELLTSATPAAERKVKV